MPKRTQPIRPDQIEEKPKPFPSFVIEAVNHLLAEKYKDGSAVLKQSEIVDEILRRDVVTSRAEIFDRGWLDFERLYGDAGWLVRYDAPARGETHEPFFVFKKAKA